MKKILSFYAVLVLATACIYPYQPDLEDAPDGILVVDGDLTIGEKSLVRVGFMSSLWPKPADQSGSGGGLGLYYAKAAGYNNGILVWAEDDAGGEYPGTIDTAGITSSLTSSSYTYYNPNIPIVIDLVNAQADRHYRVCVQVGDLLYSSDWIKPLAAPTIKNITFKASKLSDKADVTVSVTLESGPDATGYVLLSFDEAWRFHAEYYPNYVYDPRTNSVSERIFPWEHYWCWKLVDNGKQIPVDFSGMSTSTLKDYPFHSFSRYDNRNHQRYSIRLKARTINKETYQYLSHLEESTESGDNLFTPNPGEIAGNLRCETDPDRMVLGYVTVSLTATKRAYNNSQFLLTRSQSPYDLAYPPQWPKISGGPWFGEFYQMGYMPLIANNLPDSEADYGPYGWGPANCYDCIAAGGTQKQPDFWEN